MTTTAQPTVTLSSFGSVASAKAADANPDSGVFFTQRQKAEIQADARRAAAAQGSHGRNVLTLILGR